jgi:hypothetical protein
MITTEVTSNDFVDWLRTSDSYMNNFSVQGARALYDYLYEYSEETGEPMDFDPVGWCCEFTEYENFKELQDNYTDVENTEELLERTQVIPIEGTERFIIQDF